MTCLKCLCLHAWHTNMDWLNCFWTVWNKGQIKVTDSWPLKTQVLSLFVYSHKWHQYRLGLTVHDIQKDGNWAIITDDCHNVFSRLMYFFYKTQKTFNKYHDFMSNVKVFLSCCGWNFHDRLVLNLAAIDEMTLLSLGVGKIWSLKLHVWIVILCY